MVSALRMGETHIHAVFGENPGKCTFDGLEASRAYPGPYPRDRGSRAGIAVSGLSLEPLE